MIYVLLHDKTSLFGTNILWAGGGGIYRSKSVILRALAVVFFFLYHPKDLFKSFASYEKKGTYFKPDSNGSNIEIWNICQWINISYTVSKVQHATNDWNISSNFIWFNVGLAFRTNYRPKCRLISHLLISLIIQ